MRGSIDGLDMTARPYGSLSRIRVFSAGVGVPLERRPETKAVMIPAQVLAWGLAAAEEEKREGAGAGAGGRTGGGTDDGCVHACMRARVCVCGHESCGGGWGLKGVGRKMVMTPALSAVPAPLPISLSSCVRFRPWFYGGGPRRTERRGAGASKRPTDTRVGWGRSMYVQILLTLWR